MSRQTAEERVVRGPRPIGRGFDPGDPAADTAGPGRRIDMEPERRGACFGGAPDGGRPGTSTSTRYSGERGWRKALEIAGSCCKILRGSAGAARSDN
jgi:hypothetical protein